MLHAYHRSGASVLALLLLLGSQSPRARMPCINCYIHWAQQALSYLPSLLGPLVVWLFYAGIPTHSDAPPTYGPRYLPAFVRGIMAAYNLGKDEDAFMIEVNRAHGPVVYLPWPLKQYFITNAKVVSRVYETPSKTLSFASIRERLQQTIFGGQTPVFHDSSIWHGTLFPLHGKGLSKPRLNEPISMFVSTLERELDRMGQTIDAADTKKGLEVDLIKWITQVMFDCAMPTLFGPQLLEDSSKYGIDSKDEFRRLFKEFDVIFPLLAGEMAPEWLLNLVPGVRQGIRSRDQLRRYLGAWAKDGAIGANEDGMVRQIVETCREMNFGDYDIGTTLNATLWALQANGPFAAAWMILYIVQSPLYPSIRSEIDDYLSSLSSSSPTFADLSSSTSLPLLTSALYETLRLTTSSLSMRDVDQPFFLSYEDQSQGKEESKRMGCMIPGGTRLVAATRFGHLDENEWEDARVWDGRRFIDQEEEEVGTRSKRVREVRAFGGGISICEGRNLAYAELKSTVALTLSKFDIEVRRVVSPTNKSQTIMFADGSQGVAPVVAPGRPGMGVFQFEGELKVVMKRRKVEGGERSKRACLEYL